MRSDPDIALLELVLTVGGALLACVVSVLVGGQGAARRKKGRGEWPPAHLRDSSPAPSEPSQIRLATWGAAAPAPNHAEPAREERFSTFGMRYESASGQVTNRVVTLSSARGEGEDETWLAFCHLRRGLRSFKAANAIALYDPTTGAPIRRDQIVPDRPSASAAAVREAVLQRPEPISENTVLFVDVETTGLSRDDRIVSFGAVKLRLSPPGEIVWLHLVFNPGRRSSKRATELHGWDNRTLSWQDPFGPYAAQLRAWCDEGELIVAHNAEFDLRFLNDAFAREGAAPLGARSECTMLAWRAQREGSAALDAIIERLGLPARGKHGALQDAWLCMQVFLRLRDLPWAIDFSLAADPGPANLRAEPPKTRRGRARKAALDALADALDDGRGEQERIDVARRHQRDPAIGPGDLDVINHRLVVANRIQAPSEARTP